MFQEIKIVVLVSIASILISLCSPRHIAEIELQNELERQRQEAILHIGEHH